MKKRGFTLTEVLGVLVILGLIALVIFPNVSRSIKSSKQKLYEEQIARIEENARKWGVEHTAELPDTGSYYLRLNDLIVGGYVTQKELKDPRDDSVMDGCIVISFDPSYNQYKYSYTEASCDERPEDDTTPTLTVTDYTGAVGDDVALSTKYEATYGVAGGKTTCKYEETIITNVNYFSEEGTYVVKCIANGMNGKSSEEQTMNITLKIPNGSELATKDNLPNVGGGYRYQGGNPNNYVRFNGKLFRIIGIFNGQMKIIQNDFYSEGIAWDTSGSYNWARPATLNTELNSTYWDTINSTYQNMVDQNHSWGIGGIYSNYTRANFYAAENNSNSTGKVGLMSVADYGYASSWSECTDSTSLDNLLCGNNNWILNGTAEWTVTPYYSSGTTNNVWPIREDGHIGNTAVTATTFGARPVLYLKSTVKITGGEGTSSNPYTLKS